MKKYRKKHFYTNFIPFFIPYSFSFFLGVLLSILGTLSSLGLPLLMGTLADKEQMFFILRNKSLVVVLVIGVILIYVSQGLATYLLGKVGAAVIKDMENTFAERILSLQLSKMEKMSAGDLSSRLINDISQAAKIITTTIPQLIINTILILGTSVILMSINFRMTSVALIAIILLSVLFFPINKKIETLYSLHQHYLGDVSGIFTQKILNIKLVKSYLGERQEVLYFQRAFQKIYNNVITMLSIFSFLNILKSAILLLLVLGFLLYASWQINNDTFKFSEMVTFILYIIQVIGPISDFFFKYNRNL